MVEELDHNKNMHEVLGYCNLVQGLIINIKCKCQSWYCTSWSYQRHLV